MEPENNKRELAWKMYVDAVSKIILETGFNPTPIFREPYREVVLTKYGEIEMLEVTEKEVEIAKKVLTEGPIDNISEKV